LALSAKNSDFSDRYVDCEQLARRLIPFSTGLALGGRIVLLLVIKPDQKRPMAAFAAARANAGTGAT